MKVRRLNEAGIHTFSTYVKDLSAGQQQNIPLYLLDDPAHSEAISFSVEVHDHNFQSRYEMGEFLVKLFDGQQIQSYLGDVGFWSWFALLWFEQLCSRKGAIFKPSKPYNYVLSEKYNHRPRHAIYMSWQLVQRYGQDARFLLNKEMSTRGEITEQLMARQEILSSAGVMRLASKLYFDSKTNGFKRGAASRTGAGCVSRYLRWLEQVKLNYDVYNMSVSELEAILPLEFSRFLGGEAGPAAKDYRYSVCQNCGVSNRIPKESRPSARAICGKCSSPLV